MNSRERIINAMNHNASDKIPVDFGGHRSSGISAIAYSNLKKKMGIHTGNIYVYDMVQQLAIVEPQMLDIFKIDTIEMGRGFLKNPDDWKDWVLPDGTACKVPYYINLEKRGDDFYIMTDDGQELGVQKKGCCFFEQTYFPLYECNIDEDDFSDLSDILGKTVWTGTPHPGAHIPLDNKGLSLMAKSAKTLRESTDRAIIGLFGGNMFEIPEYLFRMDKYLLDMTMSPDKIIKFSEKLCEIHLKNLEKWMSAVGEYIDIVLFGDDLGSQCAPLMSVDMYRRYYKPFHSALWKRAKQLANVKTMLHCCGSVKSLLPDLIDAGIDAINPVQISADNMDAKDLKDNFGKDIVLWGGGCDTQHVLARASVDEVKEHVRRQLDVLSPSGGFVFQQVHNILANVPPENIIAMFETVDEYEFKC